MKTVSALATLLALAPLVASAAPVNDNFSRRTALPALNTFTVQGTLLGATREVADPVTSSYGTVWYSWTAPSSGLVSFSTAAPRNVFGTVIVGTNPLSGKILADSSKSLNERPMRFYAAKGATYHLCLYQYSPATDGSAFTLGWNCDASLPDDTRFVTPGSNDNFSTPLDVDVTSDAGETFVMSTRGATWEPFERELLLSLRATFFNSTSYEGGVWIRFVADITGTAYFYASSASQGRVVLLAGTGSSISGYNFIEGGYGGIYFPCKEGVTYRLYLLAQTNGYPDYGDALQVQASVRTSFVAPTQPSVPVSGNVDNSTQDLVKQLSALKKKLKAAKRIGNAAKRTKILKKIRRKIEAVRRQLAA